MHLALAIQSLALARGGAERFSLNLIRGLLARNHQITVLCHDWDEHAAALGVTLISIPRPRPWHHPWCEFSRNVWRALPACDLLFGLTQLCPQDVHRFGGGVYRDWYTRKYGRLLPLQLLRPSIRRNLAFERAMYTPGNYRQCIAISEMDRQLLMQHYAVPPERVHTVYNGFDREVFHPRGREAARAALCNAHAIPPSHTIVLFAANNYVRKGLPQGIAALLRTRDPRQFTLVVIGKPHARVKRRLQAQCAKRLHAVWLDRVSDPASYYRGADVLLFPTLYDSFANVIGEALCCGLPVITTRQAGGAEMIDSGINGYVVSDANAVDELARCLDLCAQPGAAAALSARTGLKIDDCTIARCAEQTERVLLLAWEEKQQTSEGRDQRADVRTMQHLTVDVRRWTHRSA